MEKEFDNQHILFSQERYGCADSSIAAQYVRKTSSTYTRIADKQRTVPRNLTGGYEGVLNACGEELFKWVLLKVEQGDFTDTLKSAKIEISRTGYWKDLREGGLGYLNTWNDRVLVGTRESDGLHIDTSPLILFGNGWAYTLSGSLYKFEHLPNSEK